MTNIDYEKLLKTASDRLGTTPEALKHTLEQGDIKSLSEALTPSDRQKLRALLANKQLMERLKKAGSLSEAMKMVDN